MTFHSQGHMQIDRQIIGGEGSSMTFFNDGLLTIKEQVCLPGGVCKTTGQAIIHVRYVPDPENTVIEDDPEVKVLETKLGVSPPEQTRVHVGKGIGTLRSNGNITMNFS